MVKKLQKEISDIFVEALLEGDYKVLSRNDYLVEVLVCGVIIKLWIGSSILHQHTEEEHIVRFTPDEAKTLKRKLVQQSEKSALVAQLTELQNKIKKVEEALTEVQDCATIATDLTGEVQDV